MTPRERRNKIVGIIKERGEVTTNELCAITEKSTMTINRDLRFLDKNNTITKIHGGAVYPKSKLYDLNYDKRITAHIKEKELIAKKAINFIKDRDTIILDNSTTSMVLARYLAKQNISELTVITNSNYVIEELRFSENITLISTGGEYIPKYNSLAGIYAELTLSKLRAGKLFFSVAGISIKDGLTDGNSTEIEIKNKMFEISNKIYLLIDSHKFNNVLTHKIGDISIVDVIICDRKIEPEFLTELKNLDKKIEIV
jgi:DeoR family transcriptional regulator, fructose operon transcriptional repressor